MAQSALSYQPALAAGGPSSPAVTPASHHRPLGAVFESQYYDGFIPQKALTRSLSLLKLTQILTDYDVGVDIYE